MRHALLIDDNQESLKLLGFLLEKENFNYTPVSNPAILSQLLPDLPPVVVAFVDLKMPHLDGYKVKDLLRPRMGKAPIIACSVHVEEMARVRQHGFDGFLGKPINISRFPDDLARILRGEPVWQIR